MHPVKWFHRGTAPMVAIYPDDVDGSNALKPMSAGAGLRPVNWSHNGSSPQMAIYPDDVDGTLRPLASRDDRLSPVHWFHRGTAAMAGNFNDEFVPVSGGGGAEYEGLLDIVGGARVAVSSARALSAAMLEQPAYTLQKLDGGAQPTQSFSYEADGTIDGAAITTFLDGNDGGLMVLNDHSGNGEDFESGNSPVWSLNAPNKPAFVVTGEQKVIAANTATAAGARTYAFVVDYIENENGTQFWLHHSNTDSADVTVKSFWNAANDIWVDVTSGDGGTVATWVTSGTLTTGLHLVELQFDASGNLVVLIDGVNANAVLEDGSLVALPAMADAEHQFPLNMTPAMKFFEYYLWPQQNIGATARANIKTFFGIS